MGDTITVTEMIKALIVPIILAIIGSTAFFSFLQFLITRHDNKKGMEKEIGKLGEKIDNIEVKFDNRVDEIDGKLEEHRATLARTHILRFADEQRQFVRQGITHSEEYFKQQILDIDLYNTYCEKHPEFSNGLTVMASDYIRKEYKRVYLDNE